MNSGHRLQLNTLKNGEKLDMKPCIQNGGGWRALKILEKDGCGRSKISDFGGENFSGGKFLERIREFLGQNVGKKQYKIISK